MWLKRSDGSCLDRPFSLVLPRDLDPGCDFFPPAMERPANILSMPLEGELPVAPAESMLSETIRRVLEDTASMGVLAWV